MDDIRRVGPPSPIGVRGDEYQLTVPLNARPSRDWQRAFQAPEEWTEPCHPSRITVKDRALIFTAEERHVRRWVELIDQWIATANRKCSPAPDSGTTGQIESDDAVRERQRRLQEATDRFRDL